MDRNEAIKVSGLSKTYQLRNSIKADDNTFHALSNVSFTINKGESVAVLGANGSGKSTLLKVLAGVTKPSAGSVQIHGRVASILDVGAGFHPELSGRENIFVNGELLGFRRKEVLPKVEEIIEFSGIGQFINEPVKNYSNGMFLRLAFSIVAHLDFDIYLFDEVLAVGDAEFQMKFNSIFSKLNKNKEKTLILATHQIEHYYQFIDETIILKSGEIAHRGELSLTTPSEQRAASKSIEASNFFNKLFIAFESSQVLDYAWEDSINVSINISEIKKTCFLGVSIKNSFGKTVFESYFDKKLIKGMTTDCQIELPGYTLNTGYYTIDLVFSDLHNEVDIYSKLIEFSIVLTKQLGELEKRTFGDAKPKVNIKWM